MIRIPPPGGRFPPELTLSLLKLLLNPNDELNPSSPGSIVDSLDNDFENLFFEELLEPVPVSSEELSPPPPRLDRPLVESSDDPPDNAPKVMALITAAAIVYCSGRVLKKRGRWSEREKFCC